MKVLISGEGANEIGGWSQSPPYRTEAPSPGVIEALLKKLKADGWTIRDGRLWKSIRKYRAGNHQQAETRTVLGLALAASESQCDVLVFVRDQDHNAQRLIDIAAGLKAARERWPELKIVGGIAVPCLEGWLLALLGTANTESFRKSAAIEQLVKSGLAAKNTDGMVALVQDASLARIPEDAGMLRTWLTEAHQALEEAR